MAVTDVSDLKKRRQRKKFSRFLKKFIIIFILAAVVAAIVFTKSLWYPKLDGILTKIPVIENTSELAGGNFPISIEGGAAYQLEPVDNGVAVLDDSHFFVYDTNGKNILTQQHTLANPILTVSPKKALIYDIGGNSFSLMSKYKCIYKIDTDYPILLAKLSSNDKAAVVTKDDKFLSVMKIYDNSGKNIFNYSSIERIIDVTFNGDNNGCYITTIGSKDGVLVSKILYYKFDKIDYDDFGNPMPIWQTENLETLAISVRLFGNDKIIVFGDNLCACYDTYGNLLATYEYPRNLSGYDSNDKIASLVFNNTEQRCSEIVMIDSETGGNSSFDTDFIVNSLQVYDSEAYIHNNREIIAYNILGEEVSKAELTEDYDDFRKLGSNIFLLGYDKINKIDFK
ncbi:MAG: DUF5711 family protein [Oscillospiraceae bacterium]